MHSVLVYTVLSLVIFSGAATGAAAEVNTAESIGIGSGALTSDTVGITDGGRSAKIVATPGSYALSIDGDFDLGGVIFKGGYPFLHNDGGRPAANTALGSSALVSNTVVGGYSTSGQVNTALGTGVGISFFRGSGSWGGKWPLHGTGSTLAGSEEGYSRLNLGRRW